jgi:drug/metabolite transporter (DMT)-like permease
MTSERTPESVVRLKAIALMCAAVTVFSGLDTLAKYLAASVQLPVTEIIWVRMTGNVVLNLLMFGVPALIGLAASPNLRLHVLRSLFMASTTGLNFLALKFLRLDQTQTIFFLTPFIVALLAGPVLGEWIGWRRLVAIIVGFSGVLFVTRPGFGGVHPAILLSLGAALGYGGYNIVTRYLAQRESAGIIQTGAPIAGALLYLPFALQNWVWPGDTTTMLALVAMGFIGGFGHWLLVLAHRHAPAPILSPFTYVGLPSMTLLGYLVFGDVPDHWTLIGAAIIILAGIYLISREGG